MIVIISQGSIKMDFITDINQFIKKNSQTSYNLQNFYDTLLVSDDPSKYIYRIPIDDFFIKYKDQLKVIQVPYHLPEDMYFKPKMLSLLLYGTTEYWIALLRINKMKNITEFCKPVIQVYNSTLLKDLINIFFKREGKK